MVKDLTKGSTGKILWLFALPLLGSVIFQQMYNMADTVIAGQFIGEDALSAVGSSYPITMIFMAVALGCNLGCSVVISRHFGAKHYREVRECVTTILTAVAALGVLLTLMGLLISVPIMNVLQTPSNIFGDALSYLYIYIGGFIFVLLYNVCTGIFSALGDSKTPLFFLIASSLGNIALDLVFVICFKMGVAGLAWATFLAQGIAAILCILRLFNTLKKLSFEGKAKFFSRQLLLQMCVVAIPSVLQQSFVSVGNLFIQGLVNSYGSQVIAGYTSAVKLNTFVLTTITTVAGALSSFTAQNMGAGEIDRIKKGMRSGIGMVFTIAVPFTLLYLFFQSQALGIFAQDLSETAVNTGSRFLTIVSPFYVVVGLKLMYDAVLRGTESMIPFMSATFTDLLIRVILCYIFNAMFGVDGLWLSWPVGWGISTAMSAYFYYSGIWYKHKKSHLHHIHKSRTKKSAKN